MPRTSQVLLIGENSVSRGQYILPFLLCGTTTKTIAHGLPDSPEYAASIGTPFASILGRDSPHFNA